MRRNDRVVKRRGGLDGVVVTDRGAKLLHLDYLRLVRGYRVPEIFAGKRSGDSEQDGAAYKSYVSQPDRGKIWYPATAYVL
jgi:hypothetical protein